jgi:hypothetical protein
MWLISLRLIFHTLIILLLTALVIYGVITEKSYSLIAIGIVVCIAVTVYTIWDIVHNLSEIFSRQAKEHREISAQLKDISIKLQGRELELQQCADTLSLYAAVIDSIAKKAHEATELLHNYEISEDQSKPECTGSNLAEDTLFVAEDPAALGCRKN